MKNIVSTWLARTGEERIKGGGSVLGAHYDIDRLDPQKIMLHSAPLAWLLGALMVDLIFYAAVPASSAFPPA